MDYLSRIKICLLFAALLLTACGGGGGKRQQPVITNTVPSVSAGADQRVLAETTVNLNGTASDSDGTIVQYNWVQTAGDTVTLSGASSVNASFVMPANPSDNQSQFSFTLTVTDNDGANASDTVIITLHPAPSVDAGAIKL